jgi:hypothetical protein
MRTHDYRTAAGSSIAHQRTNMLPGRSHVMTTPTTIHSSATPPIRQQHLSRCCWRIRSQAQAEPSETDALSTVACSRPNARTVADESPSLWPDDDNGSCANPDPLSAAGPSQRRLGLGSLRCRLAVGRLLYNARFVGAREPLGAPEVALGDGASDREQRLCCGDIASAQHTPRNPCDNTRRAMSACRGGPATVARADAVDPWDS